MRPTVITEIEVSPLDLALTEPFTIASGTQHHAANLLVKVTLEDGTVGLGEAAPFPAVSGETQAGTRAAVEALGQRLIGEDASRWRYLSSRLEEEGVDAPAARCGLEMAMLDAFGQHHRLPLWRFFGGAGASVETDMTVTAGDLAHATASAKAIVERGIRALKVKVGAASPDVDAARLLAVHRAAPGARLTADANGGYTVEEALDFLARVAKAGVPLALFEQPVSPVDPAALAEVTAKSRVPICADESARSAQDVLRLVKERAAHAINLKVMKTGLVQTLAMWTLARTAGLGLMIGAMVEGVLAISFSANLAAGLGGFSDVDLDTHLFIRTHPFQGGFVQTGGVLDVSGVGQGHGVVLRSPRGSAQESPENP